MDRFGQSATYLDELKQIQEDARASRSLKQLREQFERVQELRRIHSGNFDAQLLVAEAQEEIIQRARDLRSRAGNREDDEHARWEAGLAQSAPAKAAIREPEGPETTAHAPSATPEKESWRRATLLALVLTALICVVFFYLIQAARRINLSPAPVSQAPAKGSTSTKVPVENAKSTTVPVSTAPTLRLYTDLIPGTVSVDDGEAQDLKDGELVLDHLEPGRHSMKVAGRSGTASFSFDVSENGAPQPVPPLQANNALLMVVSAQNGKGRLLTSGPQQDISLDGKALGQVTPEGLELKDLGTSDHDLQVGTGDDKQRFVMTYTPAPVLTVYLKSVLILGTVTLKTNQDDVGIFINDKAYRRKTANGQIRMPLLVGNYTIRVHKDGFADPPPQPVEVKRGEERELVFTLQQELRLAGLEVSGAAPGMTVSVDGKPAATAGSDGRASAEKLSPGDHIIELRDAGYLPKRFVRKFEAGGTVSLTASDVALQKTPTEEKPAALAEKTPAPTSAESSATVPGPPAPVDQPGEQIRRGGGFVHYNTPGAAGHYSFQAHSKIGGFLKRDKLQWYAGYQNSDNYVMFSLDGKHASVRRMRDGKLDEIRRIPFPTASEQWVQVDLAVQPDTISARVRVPGGGAWNEVGEVSSSGGDFTQGKVGFYVPGNDEVAVSNFHFSRRP